MAKRTIPKIRRSTLIPPFPNKRSIFPVDFKTIYTNTKFTKTLTSRLSEINEDLVKEKCDLNQSKSTANKDRFEQYTKDKKLI